MQSTKSSIDGIRGVRRACLAVVEFSGEGREVPGLHFKAPQLDALDVLDLGKLLVFANRVGVKVAMLLPVVVLKLALLVAPAKSGSSSAGRSDTGVTLFGCTAEGMCWLFKLCVLSAIPRHLGTGGTRAHADKGEGGACMLGKTSKRAQQQL